MPVKKGEVLPASQELLALGESTQMTEKAKIKGEFLTRKNEMIPAPADPATSLRERILAISLFPDIYDRKYNMNRY